MRNEKVEERKQWVDVAKFIAIVAVLVDHTNGRLYSNQKIAYLSYYSVSLFILVMGVTSYWSYAKDHRNIVSKLRFSCVKIIRPYLVATFIYSVALDRSFVFTNYTSRVVHFNASGPLYYVLLYLQLLLVVPIIFKFLNFTDNRKCGYLIESVGFVGTLIISFFTTNYTNILDVYGGGGKLFGGTYLCLLYVGMWFGKYCNHIAVTRITSVICFVTSVVLTISWWIFISVNQLSTDSYLPFGKGRNPPSLSFGVYAILVACTLFFLEHLLKNSRKAIFVFSQIAIWGKHTLYIFLYHRLFLDYYFHLMSIMTGTTIENIWIKRIIYFVCMICGSIILEYVLEQMHKLIYNIYVVKNRNNGKNG